MARSSKILAFRKGKGESGSREATDSCPVRSSAHNSRSFDEPLLDELPGFDEADEVAEARGSRRTERATASRRSGRRTAAASSRTSSSRRSASEEESSSASSSRRKQSKSEAKRRQRSKAKADKMFDRQFGKSSDASSKVAASDEGAPRAALYKGQMGSSQKRATRMQRSSAFAGLSSGSVSYAVRQGASRAAESVSITPSTVKALTAVLCVVLTCFFLYTPLQQYYQSYREHAKLTAEIESIQSRNEALDVQTDILVSDAGMEDTVRQRFGYVKPGESMGVVVGLSDSATDGLRGSEKIEANVLSSTVKAPEEWYTPFLDALFGVE